MIYHSKDILHSDYWLPQTGYDDPDTLTLFKLAAARRAISNFVNILTLKNIPVTFVSKDSVTDGKTVHIGGDIDKKSRFDIGVGLALHEASHILYSDFHSFKNLWATIPMDIKDSAKGLTSHNLEDLCYTMYNYVEDRYIDQMVCSNAKGYRGYYKKLYNEYFNSDEITHELLSNSYRESNLNSYMFRIINLTNSNSDLYALKKLKNIYDILDLDNILRLNTPNDRRECAFDIVREVLSDLEDEIKYNMAYAATYVSSSVSPFPMLSDNALTSSISNADTKYSSESNESASFDIDSNEYASFKPNYTESGDMGEMYGIFSILPENNYPVKDFTSPMLDKQKNFINNHGNKTFLSKETTHKLNIIGEFNAEIEDTTYNGELVEVIVIKNVTLDNLSTEEFPLSNEYVRNITGGYTNEVTQGIALGNKIGNKLLLRNEVNIEKYSRRSNGRLDKKILHEIGIQNENIFYFTELQQYKDLDIHISVDASSSMAGRGAWQETLVLTTALAKAVSMLNNVSLSISFRATIDTYPCLVMAYDSSKDNFTKIKNIFPYIHPKGLTPEGLTYNSLIKVISNKHMDCNKFFINICDGQPYFQSGDINYNGNSAVMHTRKEVNKIRSCGYNILSYFVQNYDKNMTIDETCRYNFKRMYGRDSHFINICNMNQILNTIQNKMWEK